MARAQRPKLRDAPLPVIVPAPRGPEWIPVERTANGFRFARTEAAGRETYTLVTLSDESLWLQRRDT